MKIGIMQGRLTPSRGRGIQFFPFGDWENEFHVGAEIKLHEIEWIFDYERYAENPIWTEDGCEDIRNAIEESGVVVRSVCFDYFMRCPFYKGKGKYEDNITFFARVVQGMKRIGASLIEIPLVDDSSIRNTEEREAALQIAREMADIADRQGMQVGFETDLYAGEFQDFLQEIGRDNIAANYDSGNSSGLGYDAQEEISALDTMIANVHIKDRVFQGGTVPLGTGSADFDKVFSSLRHTGYKGPFILQAARGEDGNEKETILDQMRFVEEQLRSHGMVD